MANYISQISQGTSRLVFLIAGSGTSAPYTYKFFADGQLKLTYGPTSDPYHGFLYTFNETPANHTYRGDVISGSGTITDSCVILITSSGLSINNSSNIMMLIGD